MDKNKYKVSIKDLDIPKNWKNFDEFSQIKELQDLDPKIGTGCLYKATKGHTFDWHNHVSSEAAIVIGKITMYLGEQKELFDGNEIIEITDRKVYETGESYLVSKEILHKVVFEEDTMLILFWYPPFSGHRYQASFLEQDKAKVNDLYTILKDKVKTNFI